MRKLLLLLPLLLVGCSNEYSETSFPSKPKELEDCRFFSLSNQNGESVRVARCPNSATTTTYHSGKTTRHVIVIDGKQYVEKEAGNDDTKN